MSNRIAVCTSTTTPRKHGRALCDAPRFRVVLGNGMEDRIIEAHWSDAENKTDASVAIEVSVLRMMLAEAESYKPGATLSSPRAAVSV
jgi:hypothetical protein